MGNNYWMDSLFLFPASGPTKRRKHYLCLLCSQYCVCYFLNIVSNPNLPTSPKNQFRDYHAWNRIEMLMPQHDTHFLKLLKLCEKRPTCFQTLTFCRNLSFQKPWICPWIFQGFSMDFPPHGFSGRPRERPTKIFPRQVEGICWQCCLKSQELLIDGSDVQNQQVLLVLNKVIARLQIKDLIA